VSAPHPPATPTASARPSDIFGGRN
jgi:hypothetical protein